MSINANPLNPSTVMGECFETAFGIKTYVELINEVADKHFSASDKFRKKFNAYYRVRQRKADWYDAYYSLMIQQKKQEKTFEDLLKELAVYGNIEVSFSSKLLATADTNRPIWDQYVLKSLGVYNSWQKYNNKPKIDRIKKASELYSEIEDWYRIFLNSADGKACIKQFDLLLPSYAKIISDTKKIDYMLVSKR